MSGMDRREKASSIARLEGLASRYPFMFFVRQSGVSVGKMVSFRRKVRESGGEFLVVKNSLAKRAAGLEAARDIFSGPTAVLFSGDPVASAKLVVSFAKDHKGFVVAGGLGSGKLLDVKRVEVVSELPSLEQMRAKLLGTLLAPATQLVSVLQETSRGFVRVLDAYCRKSQES